MEKFLENLKNAEATIQTADHLTYMTFPLVQDKKLLLKIVTEIKNAVTNCINSILQYEYMHKRISLYKNPGANFKTFRERCATRYSVSEDEIKQITELFGLVEQHKQSPLEFVRNEKVVILSENLRQKSISIEQIKKFLALAKNLVKKIHERFLRKI